MFRRMLIANRGEIAVRIIRACRDRGITPILLCAEVDRASLAARLADEVHCATGMGPRETYLDIETVVRAARAVNADCVHPGYGFLSENPNLSAACAAAGITFIGPSPEQIRLLGNKNAARRQMAESGVPVVPGSDAPLESLDEALAQADTIGYPVLLKASNGGGGRGMRKVFSPEQMPDAFSSARSEAQAAFGSADVYMERYIARPRHVEMQIAADAHGNAVYLFERECSIQRRFQKMVEEAPSPALDDVTRRRMGEAAVTGARAIGYQSLGTFEFLVDENRNFYFLEVNTRLQVEHPVTEEITGIDLVCLQIDIAAGLPLPFTQDQLSFHGWAFEARITCENVFVNFVPDPGRIEHLELPQGPGVRVDGQIYTGAVIPPFFDSLMAKLIVRGADREEARRRMLRALDEFVVVGTHSSLPFHRWVFRHEAFVRGDLSTHFLDEHDWTGSAKQLAASQVSARAAQIAAALAALSTPAMSALPRATADIDASANWRMAARHW
ncbi:MAG: ATP-grasp domain-containing protein [Proteobacteria bacterium]|nr:ATP-grasp domain-containing protein [Pseudomonadota bacterium]